MTVALPHDTDPKLAEYAHPERLVTTDWLAEHLDDPNLVVVESDEDILLYETGHIPGAVKVDWHTELNDPITRDYLDGERFAALMRENVANGAIPFRRAYLRSVIDQVEVDDTEIRIHGRRDVLERLVMGNGASPAGVPSFVRKWRTRQDSNL